MGSLKLESKFDLILLQLFEIKSTMIGEHSWYISKAYGIQYMTYVMKKLEVVVELQYYLVWNYFHERKLSNFMISNFNRNDDDNNLENNDSLPNFILLISEFLC